MCCWVWNWLILEYGKLYEQKIFIFVYTKTQGEKNDKRGGNSWKKSRIWLIDYCLTSSQKYFSYIQDESKFNYI